MSDSPGRRRPQTLNTADGPISDLLPPRPSEVSDLLPPRPSEISGAQESVLSSRDVGEARVRSGAHRLGGAGRLLAEQRRGPGAEVAAAAAARPWGDGEAGRVFDQRYRQVESQLLDAWTQLATYVENLAMSTERALGRDDERREGSR